MLAFIWIHICNICTQLCAWIYIVLLYSVDYIKLYCHIRYELRTSSEFPFRLQKKKFLPKYSLYSSPPNRPNRPESSRMSTHRQADTRQGAQQQQVSTLSRPTETPTALSGTNQEHAVGKQDRQHQTSRRETPSDQPSDWLVSHTDHKCAPQIWVTLKITLNWPETIRAVRAMWHLLSESFNIT